MLGRKICTKIVTHPHTHKHRNSSYPEMQNLLFLSNTPRHRCYNSAWGPN